MNMLFIIVVWVIFISLIAAFFVCREMSSFYFNGDKDFFTILFEKKKNELLKYGVQMTINTYFFAIIFFPIAFGFFTYMVSKNSALTIVVAIASILTPEAIIKLRQRRLGRLFEERYAHSLDCFATCLKSGLTIMQAAKDVANNKFVHITMQKWYANLNSDLQLGISVTDAFYRFAEDTGSPDAKDVALAIDMQNTVGGKEAQVIQSMAQDIHDRISTRREIKSLFAGTASMIYIMDFIPLIIILWLSCTNTIYTDYYFSNPGRMFIFVFIAACCLIGSIYNHITLARLY